MEILYKRGYVEYHSSLYANVLKDYNLEVPGLRPAWAYNIKTVYSAHLVLFQYSRSEAVLGGPYVEGD